MKKLIILTVPFLLFSCFWKNKELDQAKKDLLWENNNIINKDIIIENENNNQNLDEIKENKIQNPKNDSYYEIINIYWWEDFKINDIENVHLIKDEIVLKWNIINNNIDKINVTFKNTDSNFPNHTHTLKQYKKWDIVFTYNAFKKFDVLDYWLNQYIVEAYIWNEIIQKTQLNIFLIDKTNIKNNENNLKQINKNIWNIDNNVFISLPEKESTYWFPVWTWTESFTYSKINNFESVKNDNIYNLDCDWITDFVILNFGLSYWNTCRPIWNDIISFNVLRLKEEKYLYEKHYADKKYWLYWILLIEEWTWVLKENLSSKNQELKEYNFDTITIVDDLYKDIVKINN